MSWWTPDPTCRTFAFKIVLAPPGRERGWLMVPEVMFPEVTFPDVTFPEVTFPEVTFPEVTWHLTVT